MIPNSIYNKNEFVGVMSLVFIFNCKIGDKLYDCRRKTIKG